MGEFYSNLSFGKTEDFHASELSPLPVLKVSKYLLGIRE